MPINQFSNVYYSWVPAGVSRPNRFTAQNIFKAATTTAPGFVAQATGTISGAVPAVDANAIGLFQGTEAVASHVIFDSCGAPDHVFFRRTNGTYASPTAIANADVLGSLQWQGRGATTYGTTVQAQIRAVATQAFTDAAKGTDLVFLTTFSGAAVTSTALTLNAGQATFTGTVQGTGSAITVGGIIARSSGTIAANPAGYGSSNLTIHGIAAESAAFPYSMLETAGNAQGHTLAFRSSRGTYSARTACLSSDTLGVLDFGGFTGAGTSLNGKAGIRALATENWSTTATGTKLEFSTTVNATLSAVVRLTIENTGKCTFNSNAINIVTTQTPATSAAAGTTGDIAWDDNYLYVRMSTGWRRIALGAAF